MENSIKKADGIARPELSLIFVVDNSGSMEGSNIASVNNAIRDVMAIMPDIQAETSNAEIKINALIFSDEAKWMYDESQSISNFKWRDISTDAGTNYSIAYDMLSEYLTKKSHGGKMPDFGGIAPIILFMTDGYPTCEDWLSHLELLKRKGWFKVALRYALAIGYDSANSEEALHNLKEFTESSERVLKVYTAEALREVIKVIAVSSTKIKSSGTSQKLGDQNSNLSNNDLATEDINKKLQEVDNVEW